jgi:hypothetical protein
MKKYIPPVFFIKKKTTLKLKKLKDYQKCGGREVDKTPT